MIDVVIPSCTSEYLRDCVRALERTDRGSGSRVVLADSGGSLIEADHLLVRRVVPTPGGCEFVFARAINDGVRAANPDADLLLLNDDTRMMTVGWIWELQRLLDDPRFERMGIISLSIDGRVAYDAQRFRVCAPREPPIVEVDHPLAFVAIVIRRRAWNEIGPLDERFVGYGQDDIDYSLRAHDAGWKLGVCRTVVVSHRPVGTYNRSSPETFAEVFHKNARLFVEKWGDRRSLAQGVAAEDPAPSDARD